MTKQTPASPAHAPDRTPLTKSQAQRLASLSNIEAQQLTGLSVAEISEKYRWQIDPNFLLFRRICGQVVKKDPVTGVEYPVPFANVYAEDTDCTILGLFPIDLPWAWFFPIFCRTEVVAQTTTDACGRFCVWVPRFEIEWILRFRRERICFLELFTKPTVANIIQYLQGKPVIPFPGPGPDPGPLALRPGTALYQKAEQLLGSEVTRRLAALGLESTLGNSDAERQSLLTRAAFPTPLPPVIPQEFKQQLTTGKREERHKAVRESLAARLNLDAKQLQGLNLNRYNGPYLRCIDILVPEWVPIIEVPDISFRVTQDVNGTGVQQVIYSEGLFDVQWGSGDNPYVTLIASPIAVSTRNCNSPDVPCGNVPSIEFVGLMPVVNPPLPTDPYMDTVNGFATRPNRPHPNGLFVDPLPHPLSEAPFTDTLQIYGCNRVDNAAFYRLEYTYTPPGSTTAGPLGPFVGLTWPLYRVVAGNLESLWPVSDSQGWYPVLAAADNWFPDLLLLDWDTTKVPNGLYTIQLEIADGAKNLIATSAKVGFNVDNSAPTVHFNSLLWRKSGGAWQTLPTDDCAVIVRGDPPSDIEIQISYTVTANHLRSLQLSAGGCAGGANLTSTIDTAQHWYENPADNSYSDTAFFTIPASDPQGAYTFALYASSRAFNPAGGDGGNLVDWNYDPVYNWTDPSLAIAVVNV
jgi:hypothetical protein